MNDELKNKSGKVKVMYVRSDDDSDKRTHNPRTGKGEVVQESLVLTVAVAPPAMLVMKEAVRFAIVSVKTHRGVPFPVRQAMTRLRKPSTVESAVKVLSILKFYVASVRKRPVSTAKTPVRPCSRVARMRLFVHGSFRA